LKKSAVNNPEDGISPKLIQAKLFKIFQLKGKIISKKRLVSAIIATIISTLASNMSLFQRLYDQNITNLS